MAPTAPRTEAAQGTLQSMDGGHGAVDIPIEVGDRPVDLACGDSVKVAVPIAADGVMLPAELIDQLPQGRDADAEHLCQPCPAHPIFSARTRCLQKGKKSVLEHNAPFPDRFPNMGAKKEEAAVPFGKRPLTENESGYIAISGPRSGWLYS